MLKAHSYRVTRQILPIGIGIVLCLLSVPTITYAGTLQWSIVDTPGIASNVIVTPSEINSIAIAPDGVTIYATDIPHNKLYKSTNGGYTWDDITSNLTSAGAALPAWTIAVAPDNPNIIAVITTIGGQPRAMFASINGGIIWQDTSCPATGNIGALDISPNYKNYDIVAGTRTGAGNGKVLLYKLSGFGAWADQGFTGDVVAAKFSPNYGSDFSLVVVSASAAGTFANIGIHDVEANTTNWATWAPAEITSGSPGSSPKANQIKTADLELPADFSGQVASQRHIYVSTNDSGTTGNAGIYRIDDSQKYRIMPESGSRMISSIAFIGPNSTGKLMAGETKGNSSLASVDIWVSFNAGATCPQGSCVIWQKAIKPPTGGASSGNGNALVAWGQGGGVAYCATSSANLDIAGWPAGYSTSVAYDESAFSISLDSCKSWNQIGIIDTSINFLSDIAPSSNSDTLYLGSVNTNAGLTGFDSVWRSVTQPPGRAWERILCVLTNSNDTILRASPVTGDTSIFFGARNTSDLYQSTDKGQTWNKTLSGVNITDFSVSQIGNITTIHVLENNSVRKGEYINQSWRWNPKTGTSLNTGHTISTSSAGTVVVGDAGEGTVALSVDGGAGFIKLPPLPVQGNVHAIVDTRIGSNVVIYAGTDSAAGKMFVWVSGSQSTWLPMSAPGQSFYGLAQAETLYCAWSNAGISGVNRTLNPERLTAPFIEWGNFSAGLSPGVLFTKEPSALKLSGGIDLWAIDNRPYTSNSGRLWSYCDCLSPGAPSTTQRPSQEFLFQPPALLSPSSDKVIPVNSDSGEINDIEFQWQHPTPAIGYDLWIAKDKEFADPVIQESIYLKTPSAMSFKLSEPDKLKLEPGTTYYWKVRVNRNIYYERGEGQWSAPTSFTIAAKPAPKTAQIKPDNVTSSNTDGVNNLPAPSSNTASQPPRSMEIPFWLMPIGAILLLSVLVALIVVVISRRRNPY